MNKGKLTTATLMRRSAGGAILMAAWTAHTVANAAGFALLEQNSSGLGASYAGAAAVAEDASTIFFNGAGLTQLKHPSVVVNGNLVDINSKFNNKTSSPALGQSLGGTGGNAGGSTLVPALYVAVPLTDKLVGGVGVNAPFGLKTEYDADWLGRFQAIKSDVKTTNINTTLAFKPNSMVSFGVGLDYQSLDAELTKNVNYTGVIAQALLPRVQSGAITLNQFNALVAANAGLQGLSVVKGNDSAWGFDIGLLVTPTDSTKIGLSYRSAMHYAVEGTATIAAPTTAEPNGAAIIAGAKATLLADGPITLDIKLPASARLALAQKIGTRFELLSEVSWTQWSSIKELRINRTSGVTLSNTVENWENVWRYALGGAWQVTPAIKLRAGAALDNSPVPDSTRTPRLPDKDRTWYSAGLQVKMFSNSALDFGYAHLKAKTAPLNQNDGSTNASGLIAGEQSNNINIIGAQATISF